MDDDEILNLLKQNADNKTLAEFAAEIFMHEFNGSGSWESKYDKLLNKFVGEVDK